MEMMTSSFWTACVWLHVRRVVSGETNKYPVVSRDCQKACKGTPALYLPYKVGLGVMKGPIGKMV